MEQSSSWKEWTVRHQFDRICKLALKGEVIDYQRHLAYRQKHEVMLSELSQKELSRFFTMDEYDLETCRFQVLGYDIEVKDALIAEALKNLTEKKRNVILLSYFMDMSDVEIAKEMNLVRSTIHEHRKRSLELLKQIMEANTDEKKRKTDPYKITFIYKTGFKNEIGNAKERFGKPTSIADKVKKMCSDISDEVKAVCSDVSDNTCGDGLPLEQPKSRLSYKAFP